MNFLTAIGVGLATTLLVDLILDDGPAKPASSGPTPSSSPSPDLAPSSLSCDQALALLPPVPGLRESVAAAIASGVDLSKLRALALALESSAGGADLTSMQRTALLRAAECVKDRIAVLGMPGLSIANPSPGYSVPYGSGGGLSIANPSAAYSLPYGGGGGLSMVNPSRAYSLPYGGG